MNATKLISILVSKIMSEMALSLFMKLSDKKLTKDELKDIAVQLGSILMSSLNDAYSSGHNGERPINGIDVKL